MQSGSQGLGAARVFLLAFAWLAVAIGCGATAAILAIAFFGMAPIASRETAAGAAAILLILALLSFALLRGGASLIQILLDLRSTVRTLGEVLKDGEGARRDGR